MGNINRPLSTVTEGFTTPEMRRKGDRASDITIYSKGEE
jgi:hypothetical protein